MTKQEIQRFVANLTDEDMGLLCAELMRAVPQEEFGPALPIHPDFVYRLSGQWKGWDHFLGVSK